MAQPQQELLATTSGRNPGALKTKLRAKPRFSRMSTLQKLASAYAMFLHRASIQTRDMIQKSGAVFGRLIHT